MLYQGPYKAENIWNFSDVELRTSFNKAAMIWTKDEGDILFDFLLILWSPFTVSRLWNMELKNEWT